MAAAPANKTSARELQYGRVERVLRERIMRGELHPGQRLVRRTLARELGVSPIPVIEALRRLEQDGLVEHAPNIGARVRPLTVETLVDDFVLREAIESQVARLLVGRLGPKQVDDLYREADDLDAAMRRKTRTGGDGMTMHARFHQELARLTGREVLVREEERIWSMRFIHFAWISGTLVSPVPKGWHRRLVAAIAAGDEREADEAARVHVRYPSTDPDQMTAAVRDALDELQKNGWRA